ncbi:MAG: hypothetical protein HFE26_00390 [Clostridia bacterium]|nr:hypothetical protein [Clostridia bacterium]
MTEEMKTRKQEFPEVIISRAEGKSAIDTVEEYLGCRAVSTIELPQEEPSEEYMIDFEEDTNE